MRLSRATSPNSPTTPVRLHKKLTLSAVPRIQAGIVTAYAIGSAHGEQRTPQALAALVRSEIDRSMPLKSADAPAVIRP